LEAYALNLLHRRWIEKKKRKGRGIYRNMSQLVLSLKCLKTVQDACLSRLPSPIYFLSRITKYFRTTSGDVAMQASEDFKGLFWPRLGRPGPGRHPSISLARTLRFPTRMLR
jgi:hypothetical protein